MADMAGASLSAMARAIGITEILEHILVRLDTKTSLFAQGVCKGWKETITTSHNLQVALFFKQSETPPYAGFINRNSLFIDPLGSVRLVLLSDVQDPLTLPPDSSALRMYPFSRPEFERCISFDRCKRLHTYGRFKQTFGSVKKEYRWSHGTLKEWVELM